MDIFDRDYPAISRLYDEYVQDDEYSHIALVKCSEKAFDKSLDESIVLIEKGNKNAAIDTMMNCLYDTEKTGFILGFTYALGLIKETNVLKELAK